MKQLILAFSTACLFYVTGCQTGHYVSESDDRFGSAKKMEYPQKARAISEMIGRMVTDPDFTDIYEIALKRAEARGHKRPTIVIMDLEDNTKPGSNDYTQTAQMRKELKSALRKTRKFAVIDLVERERMKNLVVSETDMGARDDNIENIGVYEAGDFFMFGELARENVQKTTYYHFLNLRLIDPVTGNEIWDDTVKVIKE